MTPRKAKPAKVATLTRASCTTRQADHNPSVDQCQCPRCGLSGPPGMFTPGWWIKLAELTARHSGLGFEPDVPGMNWLELFGLYLGLIRREGRSHDR